MRTDTDFYEDDEDPEEVHRRFMESPHYLTINPHLWAVSVRDNTFVPPTSGTCTLGRTTAFMFIGNTLT